MIVFALFAAAAVPQPLQAVSPLREAWATLKGSLRDGNPDHRRQALVALATIRPRNRLAVQLVETALLHDKDPQVRQTAAAALGDMKAKEAASALRQALDDDGEVAFAAAKALNDMGDPAGRPTLIAVLAGTRKDSPGLIGSALRDAKSKLRHPQTLVLMGAEDATGALFGPASMGIVAAQQAFKDRGASGRAEAALYLARDPDRYATTLLEWALADDNYGVRAAAARALGERGDVGAMSKLQFLLSDSHTAVRTMSAAAIVRIEGRRRGAKGSGATPLAAR